MILETLVAWYAPHQCIGCKAEGSLLCRACCDAVMPSAGRCYRCRALSARGRTCVACRRQSKLYAVHTATSYAGSAKELVGRLKFGGARQATQVMAELMAPLLPVGDELFIVHLPTASSRIRRRGYDQAALLARALSRQTGLPYRPCLARSGQQRQLGASRAQRLAQLRASFSVSRPHRVAGRHILLVDDVMTTGASLETAAAVLKAAGAKRVEAIVFARA